MDRPLTSRKKAYKGLLRQLDPENGGWFRRANLALRKIDITDIRLACPAPIESTINQFIKPMKIMKVARDDINPKHQYHYITYHDFGYSFLSYLINIINVCKAMGNHPQNYHVYANGFFTVSQKWARVGGGVGWGSNVHVHVHTLLTSHNGHVSCAALHACTLRHRYGVGDEVGRNVHVCTLLTSHKVNVSCIALHACMLCHR